MKILVAEDNAVTVTLMTGLLARQGFTVVSARNGTEALNHLRSDPDIQGVITDIMMPEFSGLDLLRAMRAQETWRNLPTIVTTVRDDPETVTQAVALGCREYILKPIRPAQFLERVMRVFRPEKAILMNSAEVMNRFSLDLEAYQGIARAFVAQVDETITLLQNWTSAPPNLRRLDAAPLMEGATLLGAERLLAALDDASAALASQFLTPMQCTSLLEEFQRVRHALS